ncbi:MAG TPA: cysteine desulfurase family protein [Candidatus Acidoferrales bacterium]|nr:cysteine desulfurase family protein [Candidatus Acidoferrales bacterium]
MKKARIYLDHAATTPVHDSVLAEMLPYFREAGANPSSLHGEGRRARAGLDQARDRVAASLGVSRKEITFTGSGSESDNQAIIGVARTHRDRGRHIVSTQIEHHAVLHALDALRDEGFEITLLPVDERGMIDAQTFARALRDDTILATVMYANNEIGVIEPIAQLAAAARENGVIFHTDAIQAPGWIDVRPRDLGVDLLSLSAHKFYGPKGVGVLYVREGLALAPLVHGGGQEFGRRSGTENVAGIVGLAAALERAVRMQPDRAARAGRLRDRLEAGLRAGGIRVNGEGAPRLPNYSNVSFVGLDSEALLVRFDLEGIAVSTGSACTSGAIEPSHVIAALGGEPHRGQGVIRFTLGESTTEEEIDRVLALVPRITAELQGSAS